MTFTNGCDISRWQDDNKTAAGVDFGKMKEAGIEFVYIRSSIGMTEDEDFRVNWENAKQAGLLRGAYHAYNVSASPMNQALFFVSRLGNDFDGLPPALDVERIGLGTASAASVMTAIRIMLEYIDTKRRAIIYTNPDIIINFFGDNLPSWFINHDLWIAHYGVKSPNIGSQYKNWKFWQQTDRGAGLEMGVESKQLDLDVFNGSYEELLRYCNVNIPQERSLEERVYALELWAKRLGYK